MNRDSPFPKGLPCFCSFHVCPHVYGKDQRLDSSERERRLSEKYRVADADVSKEVGNGSAKLVRVHLVERGILDKVKKSPVGD